MTVLPGAEMPKRSMQTVLPARPTYLPHVLETPASTATRAVQLSGRMLRLGRCGRLRLFGLALFGVVVREFLFEISLREDGLLGIGRGLISLRRLLGLRSWLAIEIQMDDPSFPALQGRLHA